MFNSKHTAFQTGEWNFQMEISEKITAHPQERQAHRHTDRAELRLRLASEGQEASLAALGVPRKWCAVRLIYQDGTLPYVAHYNTGLWVWGQNTHVFPA